MALQLILAMFATAFLGVGVAFAQPEEADAPAKKDRPSYMEKVDTNSDGAVDATEAEAKWTEIFTGLDKDGNGEVTVDEMKQIHAEKMKEREKKAEEGIIKRHQSFDANSDGKVTKDEFVAQSRERHNGMDADSDGKVTKEEMKKHRAAKKEEWKKHKAEGAVKDAPDAPAEE